VDGTPASPSGAAVLPGSAPAAPPALEDEALKLVLEQALAVLAEILRPINETIILDYIQTRR